VNEARSEGLILRVSPLTETSLIVRWLTPGFGRISTVAKGARRPKSPFRGRIDLFFLADFTFRPSRKSTLHTLCEIALRETHRGLRERLDALEAAATAVRALERLTESDTPLPDVFELYNAYLRELTGPPQAALTPTFQAKLLAMLGLAVDRKSAPLSPGARELLGQMEHRTFAELRGAPLLPATIDEVSRHLERSWQRELENYR
jgi:DNA repair protein RecO (recombination protein O)